MILSFLQILFNHNRFPKIEFNNLLKISFKKRIYRYTYYDIKLGAFIIEWILSSKKEMIEDNRFNGFNFIREWRLFF
jgi:hypothetical protein